ncbi:curved DNA-binding protein [Halopseudomonas pelagia]|uniref:curved DNA-binding protein n=1 Tax=Halopseudomonas pelagia TaxID=553151 RepID=UPI0003A533CF|nr:curved DNA-binding protein [Halopseudomonas pelagia]|tara:strand:+ start:231095 stop:232030 length:936 start_codon:yes stop_codon:yes gene_type:complete
MEFKDYYATLGVEPDADDKTIKTAYRKLARQYHPDVSSLAGAEEKFKEVAEAYDVLHNVEKRAEYDELRQARQQRQRFSGGSRGGQAGSAETNQDFADFFESMFGSAGARQSPFDDNRFAQKGRDVEIEMPVFLEETLENTTKPIEFMLPYRDERGRMQELKKSLKVKVPAGVRDGERIRLKGQGAPGSGNAANGDLYLHIRLVPHPLFDVEGHNLVITVPLAPWEAALGTKVTIPTLVGKIQLTIRPNSQSGQRLRIKGKGLIGKEGSGDLFAVLKVVMPQQADEATRALWTQLANAAGFDPRAEWSQTS